MTRRLAVLASAVLASTALMTAVPGPSAVGATAATATAATASDATASDAAAPSAAAHEAAAPSGSFALSGTDARAFALPHDLRRVRVSDLGDGRTATRYQQVVAGAAVLGGQVTVIEDASGEPAAVIGAYFPRLRPQNTARHSAASARALVEERIGERGAWATTLRLDPRTDRLFYEVDSIRGAHRPVRWVDAQTGEVVNAYDAVNEGSGVGVKGDPKPVDSVRTEDGRFLLRSADGRQQTYDALNGTSNPPGQPMLDADDVWAATEARFRSPDQRAAVDAHYYAGLVDDFYREVFGRDSIDDRGMQIVSSVHFSRNYCNAFWNGAQMTYGDGDGRTCLPLSGALDVVAHELSHGVTEYTSGLIYQGESGALNEAFSDIMGSTLEFYADARGADPAARPDWRIGEDVLLGGGFRTMAAPQEYGQPDHYAERYTGADDNGGVHTNSGIPNHAYYLAVNGGRNAGCGDSPSAHAHGAGCDVTVPAVGLERAQHIFYDAFTSLPEYANFCDARKATVAIAGRDRWAIGDAWAAVGVTADCAPGTPPPPPCEGDDTASVPFASPHPYGNNGDCTWVYDHGSAGFAFHFSLLDTEAGYDYVYVRDGNGAVVARYDGSYRRDITTPCIPTSTGSVQLVTDEAVTAGGFTVDAVQACTPR